MKEAVKKETTANVCDICGHTRPYHRLDCAKVSGRYCRECEARWPRHYPWCPSDALDIGRWWVNDQRMLREMFETERLARGGSVAETVPEPHWHVGEDRPLRPADGERIMRGILDMFFAPTVRDKDMIRATIHQELAHLAGDENVRVTPGGQG